MKKTTVQPPKYFFETVDLTVEHFILVICFCILFLLIIIAIYTVRCKSGGTVLFAEITNGETCVHIPLRTLTMCPTYWSIKSPSEVSSVTVRGKLSPTIEFHWSDFEMMNKLTNRKICIQSYHSISMLKGRKLRQLLLRTYSVHFFIQHESLLLPV